MTIEKLRRKNCRRALATDLRNHVDNRSANNRLNCFVREIAYKNRVFLMSDYFCGHAIADGQLVHARLGGLTQYKFSIDNRAPIESSGRGSANPLINFPPLHSSIGAASVCIERQNNFLPVDRGMLRFI
jgi:hypothetical protein